LGSSIIDVRARYRVAARRLRNTDLENPLVPGCTFCYSPLNYSIHSSITLYLWFPTRVPRNIVTGSARHGRKKNLMYDKKFHTHLIISRKFQYRKLAILISVRSEVTFCFVLFCFLFTGKGSSGYEKSL